MMSIKIFSIILFISISFTMCKGETVISKVTHVIFDLDGLLLNTEPLYEQAFGEICAHFGANLTKEIFMKTVGTSERRSCEICIEELKLNCTVDEFDELVTEAFHRIAGSADLMPGAEKLIKHLYKSKVPICVATASDGPGVQLKTRRYTGLFKLFNHIVTGGTDPEVKRPKPHPDIFFVAASRFPEKPKPEQVLIR